MIITDITQIDNMAEQMFSHKPNFIVVDINDYNRLKSSSNYLNATSVQMPLLIKTGIEHFKQAIREFKTERVNKILLQICRVSSALEVQHINYNEMCMILNAVEEHFGQKNVAEKQTLHVASTIDEEICKKVDIVWGLSDSKCDDVSDYEINVIVGYN